jgi:hypothetical protein
MGFSVYNLYNRKNAASINFRQNADSGNNEAVKPLSSNSSRSHTILNFKSKMEIKTNNMKKAIQITVLLLSFLFVSCEEVIDVNLNTTTKTSNRSLYQLAERNFRKVQR